MQEGGAALADGIAGVSGAQGLPGAAPGARRKVLAKGNLTAVVERSQGLQKKLDQAKTIMRKLYRRNVDLEKELQAAKAAAGGPVRGRDAPAAAQDAERAPRGAPAAGSQASGTGRDGVDSGAGLSRDFSGDPAGGLAEALEERHRAVAQLQAALEASLRRGAQAEAAAEELRRQVRATRGKKVSQSRAGALASQQAEHVRRQYVQLLGARVEGLAASGRAEEGVRTVVGSMFERLIAEMREREAETATEPEKTDA